VEDEENDQGNPEQDGPEVQEPAQEIAAHGSPRGAQPPICPQNRFRGRRRLVPYLDVLYIQ
jgi:hypothetical protein